MHWRGWAHGIAEETATWTLTNTTAALPGLRRRLRRSIAGSAVRRHSARGVSTPRIGHHGDVSLSETTLLQAAGDLVYARGEDYVQYVRGLRTTEFKAYASIQAKNVYSVELDWSGPLPDGSCTCRHFADGNFCKHLVATGLAAIDTGRV